MVKKVIIQLDDGLLWDAREMPSGLETYYAASTYDVDDETFTRWQAVLDAFGDLQDELEEYHKTHS